jgi:BirA family biotin operon repressor/biotin-[acetyl-CoA-carboxylase] ligase
LIVRLATVSSTQEASRDLPVGSLVVADHQSAGRGRLGRRWETPPGSALLATYVAPLHPVASLAAGVAAAEACGAPVKLKWPNDLLLGERKLGGILVELRPDRALVGIGINLSWAPSGGARLERDRDQLLGALLPRLERWLTADTGQVLERWRELASTLGRRVRVELPGEIFEGLAEALEDDGSLLVSGRRVGAGDVIHLRAPAGAGSRGRGRG